jgi:hypothetical protein
MDTPRGARLVLKAQQEVRVIEKLAIQNLERHQPVSHSNLLSEENRTHAALSQAADNAITARKSSGKLGICLDERGSKARAVEQTECGLVRISLLACGAGFHERQLNCGMERILTEVLLNREPGKASYPV